MLPGARFAPRRRAGPGITRCSAEPSAPAASDAGGAAVADAGTAVSGGRSPYSLISTANVRKALRGLAITEADHYGRLGVSTKASIEEIKAAYEMKCEELRGQEVQDDDATAAELEQLEESYVILSTEEERRLYDWSVARSASPERYIWPSQVDILPEPTEPPPAQEPDDEWPTTLVGYVFLGWIVLSVVLSVGLNVV